MDTTHLRCAAGVPLLLALLLTAAGCSGGGSDVMSESSDEAATSGDAPQAAIDAEEKPVSEDGGADALSAFDAARSVSKPGPSEQPPDIATERAIISQGTVSMLGKDVAAARFDVQKIVDAHRGEVAEEKTQTDDDGRVSRSRLVVRVPVGEFDAAMDELEGVAELESSSRSSEDVTTEVIDTAVRIRAQAESLRRVELLLARAQSIRAIMSIEAQLTRRQADLDSLKSQQAYLADQTSLSTITVVLEETPEPRETETSEREDASGFLAGLRAGWDGLETFVTGTLTVVGALLPFTVLLLVLGVPLWLAARAVVRRRQPQVATQE